MRVRVFHELDVFLEGRIAVPLHLLYARQDGSAPEQIRKTDASECDPCRSVLREDLEQFCRDKVANEHPRLTSWMDSCRCRGRRRASNSTGVRIPIPRQAT